MPVLDEQGKKDLIAAKRGPLEHELFAAELDLEVAQEAGDEALVEGPQKRLEAVKAQIKVLDDKLAEVEGE